MLVSGQDNRKVEHGYGGRYTGDPNVHHPNFVTSVHHVQQLSLGKGEKKGSRLDVVQFPQPAHRYSCGVVGRCPSVTRPALQSKDIVDEVQNDGEGYKYNGLCVRCWDIVRVAYAALAIARQPRELQTRRRIAP